MKLTHPSPNFTKGRAGQKVLALVIHIMEGTLKGTDSWFADHNSGVSAHYGVGKTGLVHSYVLESNVAWHAGRVNKPTWRNMPGINPNLITCGIEFEGNSKSIWTKSQKEAGAKLVYEIAKRWNFPINEDTVIGHWMIDATRRPNCPQFNKSRKIIDEIIEMARKLI